MNGWIRHRTSVLAHFLVMYQDGRFKLLCDAPLGWTGRDDRPELGDPVLRCIHCVRRTNAS